MIFKEGDRVIVASGALIFFGQDSSKCMRTYFNMRGKFRRYIEMHFDDFNYEKGIEVEFDHYLTRGLVCPIEKVLRYSELKEKVDKIIEEDMNELENTGV